MRAVLGDFPTNVAQIRWLQTSVVSSPFWFPMAFRRYSREKLSYENRLSGTCLCGTTIVLQMANCLPPSWPENTVMICNMSAWDVVLLHDCQMSKAKSTCVAVIWRNSFRDRQIAACRPLSKIENLPCINHRRRSHGAYVLHVDLF